MDDEADQGDKGGKGMDQHRYSVQATENSGANQGCQIRMPDASSRE